MQTGSDPGLLAKPARIRKKWDLSARAADPGGPELRPDTSAAAVADQGGLPAWASAQDIPSDNAPSLAATAVPEPPLQLKSPGAVAWTITGSSKRAGAVGSLFGAEPPRGPARKSPLEGPSATAARAAARGRSSNGAAAPSTAPGGATSSSTARSTPRHAFGSGSSGGRRVPVAAAAPSSSKGLGRGGASKQLSPSNRDTSSSGSDQLHSALAALQPLLQEGGSTAATASGTGATAHEALPAALGGLQQQLLAAQRAAAARAAEALQQLTDTQRLVELLQDFGAVVQLAPPGGGSPAAAVKGYLNLAGRVAEVAKQMPPAEVANSSAAATSRAGPPAATAPNATAANSPRRAPASPFIKPRANAWTPPKMRSPLTIPGSGSPAGTPDGRLAEVKRSLSWSGVCNNALFDATPEECDAGRGLSSHYRMRTAADFIAPSGTAVAAVAAAPSGSAMGGGGDREDAAAAGKRVEVLRGCSRLKPAVAGSLEANRAGSGDRQYRAARNGVQSADVAGPAVQAASLGRAVIAAMQDWFLELVRGRLCSGEGVGCSRDACSQLLQALMEVQDWADSQQVAWADANDVPGHGSSLAVSSNTLAMLQGQLQDALLHWGYQLYRMPATAR